MIPPTYKVITNSNTAYPILNANVSPLIVSSIKDVSMNNNAGFR